MIPEGIVTTGWPQVEAKGLDLGIRFHWWQCSLGRVVLGKRADGKYAATVGGVVLSIPRQVGKTFFVLALLVILCILFPGLKVVWTAHRTRTATLTFRTLQGLARRKKIAPHVLHIRTANGEQEVAFRNGSIIMFGAREQGFGRGFDEIDIEVFDEAQILGSKALEDMIAATNQSRHPHGALLFYMGTPPRPTDPGEAFTSKRRKALNGHTTDRVVDARGDMVFLECSADRDGSLDDPKQWRIANFSYPELTPHESMLRLRENLADDDAWRREGLGVWDELDGTGVIPMPIWHSRRENAPDGDPQAFGLDMTWDREWASIAWSVDGYVDLHAHRRGAAWVVEEVVKLHEKYPDAPVWTDPRGPAATLIEPLTAAGVRVVEIPADEYRRACGAFHDAVDDGTLSHSGHPALDSAVAGAVISNVGVGSWVWDRRRGSVISPLVAATYARWAATTTPRNAGRGRVIALD